MMSRRSGATLAVLVLTALALVGWVLSRDTPPVVSAAAKNKVSAVAVTQGSLPLTAASANAQQIEAAAALARQADVKPLTGRVTQRPDFVSALEWQVLQAVAKQSADSDKELTRLVNNLRFSKQLERWHTLPASADMAERHALEKQLLEEIPARVANREFDLAEAQKLQLALLADMVSDPEERRQRAATEAARLGVVSVVEKSSSR